MADDSREALLAELDRLRKRIRTLESRGSDVLMGVSSSSDGDDFRRLVATLPVVPWEGSNLRRNDEPFCFRHVGPQAEALLGFPLRDWYRPGFWEDRLHPDDRDAAIALGRELTRQGRDHTFEYRLVAADGRPVWVLDVVWLVRDDSGRLVGSRGFLLDVSERKKTEQSLQQTQAWLTLALEAADMICYRTDLGSGEVTFSGDPARFHGMPPEVPVQTAEETLQLIHPDDRAAVNEAWAEALAGRQMRVEFRGAWPAADGGATWFHTRARLFGHQPGRAGVLLGVTGDVTTRKREEEQRRCLEVQIHQTQQLESLGVLAGGIAHEFNNLLTTIQGYADLARGELPIGPAHGYLGEVLAASRRAAELTQQILAYAGKGRFFFQPVSLGDLVTQMSPLLAATVSSKVRLLLDTHAVLPGIEGDAGQLRQVILSLVTNASESLDQNEGTITLRMGETQRQQPPGRCAWIEVTDTGCGMDESTLARIFEPFFSTKFTGRGLGLAAVLGIVRSHGGQIFVESTPGKGSRFQVLLPATELHDAPTPSRLGLLLVVDDEDGVRNLASLVLRQAGHEVATAADGVLALQRFVQSPEAFTAALIDLTMPRMGGLELLTKLREVRPDLPVVLMTGYSVVEAEQATLAVDGTLQKPFTGTALVEVMRRALVSRK